MYCAIHSEQYDNQEIKQKGRTANKCGLWKVDSQPLEGALVPYKQSSTT